MKHQFFMRHIVLFFFFSLLLLGCGDHGDDGETPVVSWPGTSALKGSSQLTVSGTAFYEDKPYIQNGFTGAKVNMPIRHAVINLVANDGLVVLATAKTGEDGSFNFSNIDNSSRLGGVHLQLQAKNAGSSASPAEVRSINDALLVFRGSDLDDSINNNFVSQTMTILSDSNSIGGAFNILDNFLKGGAFIQKPGFCPTQLNPNEVCNPPFLTAYWQPGSSHGSSFDSVTNAITICGSGCSFGDADEYDDTIILHEYGHFIANNFSKDTSPGGYHSLSQLDQDIRLSWSEGWAHFFSAAVLGSPFMVDTRSNGVSTTTIDPTVPTGHFYTTSEMSVGGILWDIFDNPFPDDDPITTAGFLPIWKSFMNMPPTITTMEQFIFLFRDDQPASAPNLQIILDARKIEMFADAGESLESSLVVNGLFQHHTLYQSGSPSTGDEDIISFSANAGTAYTVKTFNLTNGADTFITIDSGSGLLTNDNADGKTYSSSCSPCPANGNTTLSSSISFTPTMGGTFSVRVKRSPSAPPSTGRTGSYDIKVTSP
jgi:hypothetical protein